MGGFNSPPPQKKIKILFRGFLMTWLHTEGQTVPNICHRLHEKSFENKKNSRGGPLGPIPAVKYSFVKFYPPPSAVVSGKLDPPLGLRSAITGGIALTPADQ